MAELTIEEIKKDWNLASKNLSAWRSEAKESYDFSCAKQWDHEDMARLEEEERPAITFDRVGVFVDAISGMEINNRQQISYFPVEEGDIRLNETLTHAVRYFENDCGAQDEDSEAVRDAVICGIGVTETVMDYESNPDGSIRVYRRDPLSTWIDPAASKRNLADARFVFYGDWMPKEEAEQRWPDAVFFSTTDPRADIKQPHLADRAFTYTEDSVADEENEGKVFILHYQTWRRKPVWRMLDPASGQIVNLTRSQFTAAKKLFAENMGVDPVEGRDYVKVQKKVFYRAFISGEEILEQSQMPADSFSFKFITYKRDRNARIWYGMVRTAKDPQRWANKWLSQILHIVNTNAKGGAFAEANAFIDPRKAEEDWAKANPIILMKEGAVSQGKIKERQQSGYPNGLDRLMQFAFQALPLTTGINVEVLGLADREQAASLERDRRQSAYTILAPLFAAIREYRRERGKLMLDYIKKFIPPGTLVRISGPAGEQWVPLVYQDTVYDVRVGQAPDSPDYKQKVWDAMGQIIPAMMRAGYPIPPEVLKYAPMPDDVSERWVQWIKEQGWMPPDERQRIDQMQQQLQQATEQNRDLQEENSKLRIESSIELMKIQAKAADSANRNVVKTYQTDMEAMNRRVEAALQAQIEQTNAQIKAAKLVIDQKNMEITHLLEAAKLSEERRNARMDSIVKDSEAKKGKKRKMRAAKVADGQWDIESDERKIRIQKMPDGNWVIEDVMGTIQ